MMRRKQSASAVDEDWRRAMEHDGNPADLHPADRLEQAAAAAAGGRPVGPAAHARRLTCAMSPATTRSSSNGSPAWPSRRKDRRARRSCSFRGLSSRPPRRLRRAGSGSRSSPGTRPPTRTSCSPGGSATVEQVGLSDQMWAHDGAAAARRAARRAAGAGQPGPARAAGAQDAGRGGRVARGGRGDRPGARPGAALAAAGPDRARGGRGHRGGDHRRGACPGRLHDRRRRARTAPARITRPPTGSSRRATPWSSTSAARCRAVTARTARERT